MSLPGGDRPAGRVIDANLHILDRQVVDREGRLAGKVDDLDFEIGEDGVPYVAAILAGPGALAHRIGGRLGAWIESVHERLHPETQPGPARISFGVVKKIDHQIEIALSREDLPLNRFEEWVRDRIISRIPGAEHEAE